MRYKPKDHTLKNGVLCHLRSPLPADAAAILHLMKATSDETDFMARYSDEITMPTLREEKFLESTLSSPADLMICAVVDGTIIANAGLSPIAQRERYRHRATFGILGPGNRLPSSVGHHYMCRRNGAGDDRAGGCLRK